MDSELRAAVRLAWAMRGEGRTIIKVTHEELSALGAERRVGAEFETSLLDQLPARYRVASLGATGAELQLVGWIRPNGSAWEAVDVGRRLLFLGTAGRGSGVPDG
jgi:hypothetical protein